MKLQMMPFCESQGQPRDEVIDPLARDFPQIESLAF